MSFTRTHYSFSCHIDTIRLNISQHRKECVPVIEIKFETLCRLFEKMSPLHHPRTKMVDIDTTYTSDVYQITRILSVLIETAKEKRICYMIINNSHDSYHSHDRSSKRIDLLITF
eukprot:666432_1